METPKKRLFHETEGGEDGDEDVKKAKHLERIKEEMLPKPIRDAQKARQVEGGGSGMDSPQTKGKGKGRGRGRGRGRGGKKSPVASPKISPSIQKEKARRQRKKKAVPVENEDVTTLDDELLRGLVLQTLKPVDVLNYDDLKTHLRTNIPDNANQHSDLSVYWNRPACGVRWLGDPAKSQVAYFSFKHSKVKGYNHLMTSAFSAGSLLVSYPNIAGQLCVSSSGFKFE